MKYCKIHRKQTACKWYQQNKEACKECGYVIEIAEKLFIENK